MSLTKRGNILHFAFMYNGRRYRGSCKTSNRRKAEKIEAIMLARVMEDGKLPGPTKVPTLADFSERFFAWLVALPRNRSPKPPTRKYYRVGWRLLESTKLISMRVDQITTDDVLAIEIGSSPANTNNALRTLRHMLRKAHEWHLVPSTPVIKMVEEHGREQELEQWMEEKLLAVTENARRPTSKHAPKSANYGWRPFRDVLLIILDTGMRPAEVFRMEWEHIKWDRGVIFVPRSKSKKSKRFVGLTERVCQALHARLARRHDSPFVFPSKRSVSGHIETVQKQFDKAKKLAGIPDSIVLYCARHRFSTDAMDATGNIMAVMDAMGHERVDTLRIYNHPELARIREAMNKRNEAMQQIATKLPQST